MCTETHQEHEAQAIHCRLQLLNIPLLCYRHRSLHIRLTLTQTFSLIRQLAASPEFIDSSWRNHEPNPESEETRLQHTLSMTGILVHHLSVKVNSHLLILFDILNQKWYSHMTEIWHKASLATPKHIQPNLTYLTYNLQPTDVCLPRKLTT